MDSQTPSEDEKHVQHPAAGYSAGDSAQVCRPPHLPEEGRIAAGSMQPEDEQLSEGDRRHLYDPQESDHTLRQALVCNLGLPGQRRQSGECGQDAGPLQHQDDAALRPGSRQLHSPGHESSAGRAIQQYVNTKAAA